MKIIYPGVLAMALLAGCDGNPFVGGVPTDPGTGGGTPAGTVPKQVSQDMNAMSYEGGVLKIDMQGVTSSPTMATFVRDAALDISSRTGDPAYKAYVYQEGGSTRSYLAYVGTNTRGNLVAVSAGDGGQFNQHNSGGRFMRLTSYTKPVIGTGPDQGLFTYQGGYVGIFSPGAFTDSSSSLPPEFRPVAPFVTTGDAIVNVDFAHGVVEGAVANRQLFDQNGVQVVGLTLDDGDPTTTDPTIDTTTLQSLVLREAPVDSSGQFLGNVEFSGNPGGKVGDYAGAFGGLSASDVAGVLWLNPISGHNDIGEVGNFNLPRCDLAGASPLCIP